MMARGLLQAGASVYLPSRKEAEHAAVALSLLCRRRGGARGSWDCRGRGCAHRGDHRVRGRDPRVVQQRRRGLGARPMTSS